MAVWELDAFLILRASFINENNDIVIHSRGRFVGTFVRAGKQIHLSLFVEYTKWEVFWLHDLSSGPFDVPRPHPHRTGLRIRHIYTSERE